MTKNEFLEKLRQALNNDLTGSVIQENVDYYSGYIQDQVDCGKSEEEVIAELGDPWVLAQTIIDTNRISKEGQRNKSGYHSGVYGEEGGRDYGKKAANRKGIWHLILVLLSVVVILCIIIAVVGGIISLVAPVLVPVLIIVFILRLFSRDR